MLVFINKRVRASESIPSVAHPQWLAIETAKGERLSRLAGKAEVSCLGPEFVHRCYR